MNTMGNMNEIEVVEQAMEAMAEIPKTNWKAVGVGTAVVGAVAALGYGAYRLGKSIKAKMDAKKAESENIIVIDKRDYQDEESEEY